MGRILSLFALVLAISVPTRAGADPADVNAAARGVVRVVIIGQNGEELYPVSHGTGFAVASDKVVTNAHVVQDAVMDKTLEIGVVPSGGREAVYAKLVAVSTRNDLALIELTGSLRLPPLALSGGSPRDSGEVSAVGYPMNVDRAQGLEISDIFRSQPPVKSRGSIAGSRPSRQFDTILHTAPIARGNSGGPLLDECGRVLGVNSFGADNEGGDAEFFFAVSNRELIPFLRANGVEARINELPCRSLADLDAEERERAEREQMAARQSMAERSAATKVELERAQLEAEQSVLLEREDRMALAFLLILIAFGLAQFAWWKRQEEGFNPKHANLMLAGAAVLVVAALALYLTRPGLDEIDRRVAAAMRGDDADGDAADTEAPTTAMKLTCTIEPGRSRITSSDTKDVPLDWSAAGCVNGRTQYGFSGGSWSRVFVPNEEDAVSVSSFDPERREFRTERYLLDNDAIGKAREARGKYKAPSCGAEGASAQLGDMQSQVLGQLPSQPNDRLVYSCAPRSD